MDEAARDHTGEPALTAGDTPDRLTGAGERSAADGIRELTPPGAIAGAADDPAEHPFHADALEGAGSGSGSGRAVEVTAPHPAVPTAASRPAIPRRGRRTRVSRPTRPITRGRMARRITAAVLLVAVLALSAVGAVNAYQQYSHVRAEALDGVARLKHVQALLQPLLQHPSIPDAATLQSVAGDLRAAEHDFALTRRDLGRGVFAFAANVPQGEGLLDPVAALSAAADEACQAGLDLMDGANLVLPLLHTDLFPGDTPAAGAPTANAPATPALTTATVQQVTRDYEAALPHLTAAVADLQSANLSALPPGIMSTQQLGQIHSLLAAWPRIAPELATVDAWLHVAPTLLGLNGPTRLLVELMDRGEMRASGGYIGDYGILTIQDGKMAPFALKDVYSLDYYYYGHTAPAAYPWWPFRNWALRDSNLSPDFPTSAQMGMQLLTAEGQPAVQGAVALTAPAIERVLAVLGPITVPEYNQVVTATNLEDLIRLYTESPAELLTWGHQRFTILLGHAFMSRLHGLSTSQMAAIAQAMLASLRAKDIQVYMSDPAVEALLAQQDFDGAVTRGPGDGLTIADDNVSVNKASAVTTITASDAVSLDLAGTATHHLTITYDFDSSKKPDIRPYFFNADWYLTYLRVYAPPGARLAAFDGFNRGGVQLGASDVPGRAMWGGYVLVRDGVPYALHFVWSVPGAAVAAADGQRGYTLTVQHQAGSNQQLDLSVTGPGATTLAASYHGALDRDRSFTVTGLAGGGSRLPWWPW